MMILNSSHIHKYDGNCYIRLQRYLSISILFCLSCNPEVVCFFFYWEKGKRKERFEEIIRSILEQYGRYECVTKDVGYSKCHAFVVLNKQMLLIVLNYVVRFFNLFKCHAYSPSSCRIQLNYFRDVVQLYSNNNCFCHKRIGLSKGKSLLSKKKKSYCEPWKGEILITNDIVHHLFDWLLQ